jgi:hypothetical protein
MFHGDRSSYFAMQRGIRGRNDPRKRDLTAHVEQLESRALLTTTATLSGGTLLINAGSGDTVSIGNDVEVPAVVDIVANGSLVNSFDRSAISSVLGSFAGANTLVIDNSHGLPFNPKTTVLFAGNGSQADHLSLSGGSATSELLIPADSLQNGVAQIDGLSIEFTADFASILDDIAAASAYFNVPGPVVHVANGVGTSNVIDGNGGVGFSVITYSQKTAVQIDLEGPEPVYATVNTTVASPSESSFSVDMPGSDDRVALNATPANVVSHVYADGSSDKIGVTNPPSALGNIVTTATNALSPVEVDFFDYGNFAPVGNYANVGNQFSFGSGANARTISYFGPTSLYVNGGTGSSSFQINSTSAGSPITYNSIATVPEQIRIASTSSPVTIRSTASDVIDVGSSPTTPGQSTLSAINGTISTSGPGKLVLLDGGDTAPASSIFINEMSVSGLAPATINYGDTSLVIRAGQGVETFHVAPSTPTAQFTSPSLELTSDGFPNPTGYGLFFFDVDPSSNLHAVVSNGSSGKSFLQFDDQSSTSTISPRRPSTPSGTVTATYPDVSPASAVSYSGIASVTTFPDANRSFIQSLYHDVLGRSGSLVELDAWVFELPILGVQGVVKAIHGSTEAQARLINGLYSEYLGRQADPNGLAGFEKLLGQGGTQEQIATAILGSTEYFAKVAAGESGPAATASYIQALYSQLLGRNASLNEVTAWSHVYASIGQAAVAADVLGSTEYRSIQVTSYYTDLLRRTTPPSANEVLAWADSNLDLLTIREDFESSTEFFDNGI